MRVEVAYALQDRQWLANVELPDGTGAAEAARAAVAAGALPSLRVEEHELGVWGRKVSPEHRLRDGERVEVYRLLRADPKEVRRALAAAGKTIGGKCR